MDRLGFWGLRRWPDAASGLKFQYPLMDRLGFWGQAAQSRARCSIRFQYPLMDRLGFWGCYIHSVNCFQTGNFSIR